MKDQPKDWPFTLDEFITYISETEELDGTPSRLVDQWNLIHSSNHQPTDLINDENNEEIDNEDDSDSEDEDTFFKDQLVNPLHQLCMHVQGGNYPSPNELLFVRYCYERYLDQKGKLSLEEAFFGPTSKRRGNYSARRYIDRIVVFFIAELERPENKEKSQIKVAENFIERRNLPIEPESLVRKSNRLINSSKKS